MRKSSRLICMFLVCVFVLGVTLTGCGNLESHDTESEDPVETDDTETPTEDATEDDGDTDDASAIDTSKHVELVMYLIGSPAKDYDEVLAEFNEKLEADINATLKVNWIGWGDFGTKYPLVLASGEPIDLIYTSTWLKFYQEAQKGAFKSLDELAPKYAPKSYAAQSEDALKQATVDGNLYALTPNYTTYGMMGYIVRGDLMDKYGITEIKSLDDYGEYLDAVVKNDKGMDPSGFTATQNGLNSLYLYQLNLYPLSGDEATNSPFWIDIDDPEGKVINFVERPEMPDYYAKMKEWSDRGYWPKSVLSNKDDNMMDTGKSASRVHNIDSWIGAYMRNPEWDVRFYPGWSYSFPLSHMQDAMAVPASSQNPERALMMLEKIRTDEDYYDLLTYGIEGKHFELTGDKNLKPLDQEAFSPEGYCSWGFKDIDFFKPLEGSPSNLSQVREEIEDMAKDNPYITFNIDLEPIKNEYAAIINVMQQYEVPLRLGYVDPVKGLATLKEQLKAAGVDKVQEELQRQVDEFRKDNQ